MGLFGAAAGFLEKAKKAVVKGLDTLAGVYTNPITALTKGAGAARQEFLQASKAQRVTRALGTAALTVAPVAAGGRLIATKTAAKLIGAALATPLIAGVFEKSPKARGAAIRVLDPQTRGEVGEKIGGFIEEPVKKTKEVAKKIVVPAAIGAGVAGAAALAAPKVKAALSKSTPSKISGSPAVSPSLSPTTAPLGAVKPPKKPQARRRAKSMPMVVNSIQIQNVNR